MFWFCKKARVPDSFYYSFGLMCLWFIVCFSVLFSCLLQLVLRNVQLRVWSNVQAALDTSIRCRSAAGNTVMSYGDTISQRAS